MAGRPADEDGRRMALELAAEDWNNQEIADVLGVSKSTVWRWVTDNGNHPRGREHLRRIDRDEIRRLRKLKWTWDDIGESVGCSPATARKLYYGQPTGGKR